MINCWSLVELFCTWDCAYSSTWCCWGRVKGPGPLHHLNKCAWIIHFNLHRLDKVCLHLWGGHSSIVSGTGTFSLFICPEVTHSTAWQRSLYDPGEVQVPPATKINRTAETQAAVNATETPKSALERAAAVGFLEGCPQPGWAVPAALAENSGAWCLLRSLTESFPFSWCV